MNVLANTKVLPILSSLNGRLFGAEFIKKDGSVRRMVARMGVSKDVAGTGYSHTRDTRRHNITVYEMREGGRFRAIPLDRLLTLTIDGKVYEVTN